MNDTVTNKTEGKLTIGVDLGDRSSQCCVLDPDGEVLEQSTLPTTQAGLRRWFAGKESARVILEAVVVGRFPQAASQREEAKEGAPFGAPKGNEPEFAPAPTVNVAARAPAPSRVCLAAPTTRPAAP